LRARAAGRNADAFDKSTVIGKSFAPKGDNLDAVFFDRRGRQPVRAPDRRGILFPESFVYLRQNAAFSQTRLSANDFSPKMRSANLSRHAKKAVVDIGEVREFSRFF
jgi:hypothetical protein